MSIDTTFKPGGPGVALVSGTPVQALAPGAGGTFRVVNTTAANAATRINWATSQAKSAVPTGPGLNSLYLLPNEAVYIEVPQDSWFNIAALGTAEIVPGQGGVGG
jgi:hypothetical protein